MKPVDAKSNLYINSSKEITDKNLKFKIGDITRLSRHKNAFGRAYVSNWSEDVFVIKKFKNTVPWRYINSNLKGEVIVETFYDKKIARNKSKRVQS